MAKFTEKQREFLNKMYTSTRNSPTSASLAYEREFNERISPERISKYWGEQKFPKNKMGGPREKLSDYRMMQLQKEFGNGKGLDIIAVSSFVHSKPEKLVQRCEELGIQYYNVPKSNGNGYRDSDFLQHPDWIAGSSNGRRSPRNKAL